METPPLRVRTLSHRCKGFCPRPPGLPPLNGDPHSKGAATRGQEQRLQGAETVTPGPEQDAPHPQRPVEGHQEVEQFTRAVWPAFACLLHPRLWVHSPPAPALPPPARPVCGHQLRSRTDRLPACGGTMACGRRWPAGDWTAAPESHCARGGDGEGLSRPSSEVVQTRASISALRRTNCVSLKRALSPLT